MICENLHWMLSIRSQLENHNLKICWLLIEKMWYAKTLGSEKFWSIFKTSFWQHAWKKCGTLQFPPTTNFVYACYMLLVAYACTWKPSPLRVELLLLLLLEAQKSHCQVHQSGLYCLTNWDMMQAIPIMFFFWTPSLTEISHSSFES